MAEQPAEPDFLAALSDELSLALGQAIWAFGRIEWLIYRYLKRLSRDGLDLLLVNQRFRTRTAVLKKLIERSGRQQDQIDRALRSISAAESLSDDRNTLAHNPWQIWIDIGKNDFMTEIQRYPDGPKKMNLEEVRAFVARCEDTAAELQAALSPLPFEPWER